MAISLRNRQRMVPVETAWLRRVGQKILRELDRPTADCSVVLVDDAAMAALNRTYRKIHGPTDVLAFPMAEGPLAGLTPDCLGDVVISAETAARQARAGGLRAELALLLAHGILHLLGHDHGSLSERRRMWRRQENLLAACGIAVPRGWATRAARS